MRKNKKTKNIQKPNKQHGQNPLAKKPMARAKPMTASKKPAPKGISCTIVKLGARFGFASPVDDSGDIFIPGRLLKGAMPGDTVTVALIENPRIAGTREGEVLNVTEQKNSLAGTFTIKNGMGYFLPDNAPEAAFAVKKGKSLAVPGDKVAAEIVKRGTRHSEHQVNIVMRFGSGDSAKDCAKAIVYSAGIPVEFAPETLQEAAKYKDAKPVHADFMDREDLRSECIFTIDSASTKDIDDAISAKALKNGYELAVHIADVSHYVLPHSELDNEALSRGNSVYYANNVIPMLPEELSNGICSLNPQVDRLAFSCIMQLDKTAKVVSYRFAKTVICSKIKGVYAEINEIFGNTADENILQKYKGVHQSLDAMHEIYAKLIELRKSRGNIDIESDEPYLELDDDGVCVGIAKRSRGDAEKLIEEFMLLANGCSAAYGKEKGVPFVYRVHEKPPEEKVETLKEILTSADVDFHFLGDVPTQQELSVILDKTRGTGIERFVHTGVLRSMSKAKYDTIPMGHFGLALEDYAHFTSPIRRYSDLAVHRILADCVAGKSTEQLTKKYKNFAQKAAVKASECEIKAQKIERSCDDSYKAEYMRQFISEEFSGVISSVTSFGIYVELGNTVEGLVHVSMLSKNEMVLHKGISLADPLSGKMFKIGQEVNVKVTAVDVARGNIDFALAE